MLIMMSVIVVNAMRPPCCHTVLVRLHWYLNRSKGEFTWSSLSSVCFDRCLTHLAFTGVQSFFFVFSWMLAERCCVARPNCHHWGWSTFHLQISTETLRAFPQWYRYSTVQNLFKGEASWKKKHFPLVKTNKELFAGIFWLNLTAFSAFLNHSVYS